MAIRIERPIWFTIRRTPVSPAAANEIRPIPVRQGVLPGWMGDESTGWSKEELERKISNNRQSNNNDSKKGIEVIDTSSLSDEEFTDELERISHRKLLKNSSLKPAHVKKETSTPELARQLLVSSSQTE